MNLNKCLLRSYEFKLIACTTIFLSQLSCQKTGSVPKQSGVSAITVVNAVPNTVNGITPVYNTSNAITWFIDVASIAYGGFFEYSSISGLDTIYAVQSFGQDTLNIGPKMAGQIFYNVLSLQKGSTYSLFLCGSDTTSPDYLLTEDTLTFYPPTDSVTGIRFVNLSMGSNPISINVEGSSIGSEAENLPYKGITSFKQYQNNSTTMDYFFVIRDAVTGDSLTQFDFINNGSYNSGYGLIDFTNNKLLTFRNITIALIGQPGASAAVPQTTILIDNY